MDDQNSFGQGASGPLNAGGPSSPSPLPQRPNILHRVLFNAKGLRSGWRVLVFAAIWFVALSLLGILAGVLVHHFHGRVSSLSPGYVLVFELFSFLAVLVAASVMALFEKRSFADYLLPGRSAFKGRFWLGVFWGWAALTGLLFAIRLEHGFFFGHFVLSGSRLPIDAGLWALAFLLTAFFEEFSFRGYPLYTLSAGIGFWPAAVILSCLFGLVHLSNIGENWAGALAAGSIGLFLCFTVRRTGSLWFAIGLHAMWDYAETFLYSVPDSGLKASGHLLGSSLRGPKWLTGGSVGPEGSALVFVLIGILFLLFHLFFRKAKFPAPAQHS
jgi:uncharacterized protein